MSSVCFCALHLSYLSYFNFNFEEKFNSCTRSNDRLQAATSTIVPTFDLRLPNPMEFAPSLPDYEDSYPIYPTPSPILSPEKSTAGLGLPEIGHDCSKKAKTPRSSQTNGNLVTLDENDGEGPKKKFPRLDEPQINIAVVDEPGDDEEDGKGNGEDQEGGEGNPWDESCLPEDVLSMLQQVLFLLF